MKSVASLKKTKGKERRTSDGNNRTRQNLSGLHLSVLPLCVRGVREEVADGEIGGETMTRKRFLKLVMSYEIQRNEAERIARNVVQYGSYENMLVKIEQELKTTWALNRAKRSLEWFKDVIIRAVKTIYANVVPAFIRFAEAAREAQESEKEKEIARENLAYMADKGDIPREIAERIISEKIL